VEAQNNFGFFLWRKKMLYERYFTPAVREQEHRVLKFGNFLIARQVVSIDAALALAYNVSSHQLGSNQV
jgi:hypothetical protein